MVNMRMRKKISVCVATYNGEKYIVEQLMSIMEQIDINDEVIISDNNSTDKTISKINSIGDSRIKIFINNNQGINNNFDFAISKCKNDYIFLSDQDDIWMGNKIKIYSKYFDRFDLIMSKVDMVAEKNVEIMPKKLEFKSGIINNFYKSTVLGCTFCFNRRLMEEFRVIPNTRYFGHDLWIYLVAVLFGARIKYIDKPTIFYRRHIEANSFAGFGNGRDLLTIFISRFVLAKHILIKIFNKYI